MNVNSLYSLFVLRKEYTWMNNGIESIRMRLNSKWMSGIDSNGGTVRMSNIDFLIWFSLVLN